MWGEPDFIISQTKHRQFQLTRPVWGEPVIRVNPHAEVVNFNSLAPCGANLSLAFSRIILKVFQLTRPVWGEPHKCLYDGFVQSISTHSPRVGRTVIRVNPHAEVINFNSLAPCGANRSPYCPFYCYAPFQLTRPVWGEPVRRHISGAFAHISTHSPRVGRTNLPALKVVLCSDFNSLAPCGANPSSTCWNLARKAFQLTRPVWGEPPVAEKL